MDEKTAMIILPFSVLAIVFSIKLLLDLILYTHTTKQHAKKLDVDINNYLSDIIGGS